jgi:hypothetical protein
MPSSKRRKRDIGKDAIGQPTILGQNSYVYISSEDIETLKNTIETTGAIKDWNITQKDKKELHGYMTKPAVKVGPNQFLTQFQNDLQGVFKDKEKMILLAKIISSDFDATDLKEKAKTEVIRETRQKINNQKANPSISTKGSRNKGLADYF